MSIRSCCCVFSSAVSYISVDLQLIASTRSSSPMSLPHPEHKGWLLPYVIVAKAAQWTQGEISWLFFKFHPPHHNPLALPHFHTSIHHHDVLPPLLYLCMQVHCSLPFSPSPLRRVPGRHTVPAGTDDTSIPHPPPPLPVSPLFAQGGQPSKEEVHFSPLTLLMTLMPSPLHKCRPPRNCCRHVWLVKTKRSSVCTVVWKKISTSSNAARAIA